MPTVNRIKFVNIGHRNALFDDLTLSCYNKIQDGKTCGANSYILADNGVGKTSLIGLIFSVIRPFNYEFPRGEGNKKRELGDYIPKEGTSHVLIEWILDDKQASEIRLLLTGMAVEQPDGRNMKQLFYAIEYTKDNRFQGCSLEDFPIFDENNHYKTINNLKSILKDKKNE